LDTSLQEKTRFLHSLHTDCEELLVREKRFQQELEDSSARLSKEKRLFEESLAAKDREVDNLLKSMRAKHQEDLNRVRVDYDQSLAQIKAINQKDKDLLETMLKQCQDRLKRGENEKSGVLLETENRYLRDIKQISDSFEAYKRQVERWRGEVKQEREAEAKKQEDLEATIARLKQNIRAQANHHEVNTKRMRDKIAKYENDLEE